MQTPPTERERGWTQGKHSGRKLAHGAAKSQLHLNKTQLFQAQMKALRLSVAEFGAGHALVSPSTRLSLAMISRRGATRPLEMVLTVTSWL